MHVQRSEPRSAFVSHPGSQRYPNTKAPRRGIKTKITSAFEKHPTPPCWGALATERHVRSDAPRLQSTSRCVCGRYTKRSSVFNKQASDWATRCWDHWVGGIRNSDGLEIDTNRMEDSARVFYVNTLFQVKGKPRRLPNLIIPGCHRLFLSPLPDGLASSSPVLSLSLSPSPFFGVVLSQRPSPPAPFPISGFK